MRTHKAGPLLYRASMIPALPVRYLPLVLVVTALAAAHRAESQQPPQTPATLAFVGVNVVPMDKEGVIAGQTVVVENGRITAIGRENGTVIPAGAHRIDGRGKYLMPGLADMHAHLPPGDGSAEDAAAIHMQLYLANGVTTVRGMMGHPSNLVLRDRVAAGKVLGPTIFAGSPPLSGENAATPEAAEKMVTSFHQAGFDLLKVWEGLSSESYTAVIATARKLEIPIGGHVTASVGLERALEAGQSSIEHLDGYLQAAASKASPVPPSGSQLVLGPVQKFVDPAEMQTLAERTRRAGVFNTPTLTLFKVVVSEDPVETFLAWPEMKYISAGLRAQFAAQKTGTYEIPAPAAERRRYVELRNTMVKALSDARAGLLVGPDSPQMFLVPGFATHREIQSLVDAGLTPYQALAAATRAPAEYLGQQKEFGTVEIGRRADLLLVQGNPLQDVANARNRAGVVLRGQWLPAADLDAMLTSIANRHQTPSK
jgi:imidazolonepropionase-like amidohydrolase